MYLQNNESGQQILGIVSHYQLARKLLTEIGNFNRGLKLTYMRMESSCDEGEVLDSIINSRGKTQELYASMFPISLDEMICEIEFLSESIAKVYAISISEIYSGHMSANRRFSPYEPILWGFKIATESLNNILQIAKSDRRLDDILLNAHMLEENSTLENPFKDGVENFVTKFREYQYSFLNDIKSEIGSRHYNAVVESVKELK